MSWDCPGLWQRSKNTGQVFSSLAASYRSWDSPNLKYFKHIDLLKVGNFDQKNVNVQ